MRCFCRLISAFTVLSAWKFNTITGHIFFKEQVRFKIRRAVVHPLSSVQNTELFENQLVLCTVWVAADHQCPPIVAIFAGNR
jgi:hypothetical protein